MQLNRATGVAPLNSLNSLNDNLLASPAFGPTAGVGSVAASFGEGRELLAAGDKRGRITRLRTMPLPSRLPAWLLGRFQCLGPAPEPGNL